MNIEEKAKRYADRYPNDLAFYGCNLKEVSKSSYTAGYTQAVTDLSAENDKLREALREIIELEEIILCVSDTKRPVSIDEMESWIAKAKQLITE